VNGVWVHLPRVQCRRTRPPPRGTGPEGGVTMAKKSKKDKKKDKKKKK
jgi:hypothetical protein